MKTNILYIFTRTPLHVGAGSSVGAVDSPVIRERHTGFPIIPGSSIKGVIADIFLSGEKNNEGMLRTELGHRILGKQAHELDRDSKEKELHAAGEISFGEAKLLAFPVRSAKGCFVWLTSPLLLSRWERATNQSLPDIDQLSANECYCSSLISNQSQTLFEEYLFQVKGKVNPELINAMKNTSSDQLWKEMIAEHLCIVSDEMLGHFSLNACEIAQHVCIDDETGTAKEGYLFNQENVPAETLFYAPFAEIRGNSLKELKANIPSILQFGADASTGLGFCTTNF